jgi:hypothetical protein
LHKNAGTQDPEKGSPTNFRCKAPHLIKIILAYSPKKKRADPIEDESEVQQGHFCPPPFSRSRTWTLPLIQLPASKQLAFPLQGMEVWRNRHQDRGIFSPSQENQWPKPHRRSIHYISKRKRVRGPPERRVRLSNMMRWKSD